jgi:twitching motility protein PilT
VGEAPAPVEAPAPADGAIPGFTPAPAAPVLPMPQFMQAQAPAPVVPGLAPSPSAPMFPMPAFVPAPQVGQLAQAPERFVEDELTALARESADPDLIDALSEVLFQGASDLHVSADAAPLLRIDGSLAPMAGQQPWSRDKVTSALYSILKPEQRARFEEVHELDFAFTLSANARFRVNFYIQRGVVGGAFRIIPTEIKSLNQLGVPEVVGEFAKLPRGLVLVTGPTGSGKSTTLAALVDLVNQTRSDHIVTVEDPIEFMHKNKRSLVNQREVGYDTHSFGNALKHVLRQDPDVILIGELRDLETISVALTAAETGHLVFATLHTQDAGQTIDRVIDVFPPHQQAQVRSQLAATLQGVVCQTLVKRSGGSGRAVATEVLVTTPAIANLIREGKTYQVRSAMQAGRGMGMHTMDQHLAELVNGGVANYSHALEKVHDIEDFKRLVHRTNDDDSGAGTGFGSQLGA